MSEVGMRTNRAKTGCGIRFRTTSEGSAFPHGKTEGDGERGEKRGDALWEAHSFKDKTNLTNKHKLSPTVRASLLGSSEIVTLIAVKIHTPLNTHIDANVRIVNSNMKHRFLQNELKTTDTGETLWECLMNQMLLYGIEYCHIKTLNQMQPHVLGCCHSLHQCVRWIISISAGRSQGITEICHVLQPLHLRMVRKDKMTALIANLHLSPT